MDTPPALFAALVSVAILAALSTLHCAAMCGPLASCASGGKRREAVRYHLGRALGYGALGATVGGLGSLLPNVAQPWVAAVVAWLAALILVAAAVRTWRGSSPVGLVTIGRAPAPTPAPSRSMRLMGLVASFLRRRPLLAGGLTSLLPCGVLWAALAIALGAGSAAAGGLVMVLFAGLTGVSVALATLTLRFFRLRLGTRPVAIVLALSALAFVLLPLPQLVDEGPAEPPACPLHEAQR